MLRRPDLASLLVACALGAAGCATGGTAPAGERDAAGEPDALARSAITVEDMMVGRFPGVRVYQSADGGVRIRLWGPGSLGSNQEPLYVVDGMTVQVDRGRGLYWLNPADVADIEVLKDVSAMAMYGVRGANGVVVITTRQGSRPRR